MSYRQELVTYLCDATQYLKAMSTLMIFFGMLSLLSLVLASPGTAQYALSVVNFTIAALGVVSLTTLFWYCRNRPDAY